MGMLVGKRYRTKMFANLADHTYVECGTGGRAWGCWGGKTGGSELRRGEGSTRRADAIAGPDERAGITCYLINGVCHQAANRVLLPAGITVQGAVGYEVSSALFGPYGRPRGLLGFCRAPFKQHLGVSGDLPPCIEAAPARLRKAASAASRDRLAASRERRYVDGVLAIYRKAGSAPARFARGLSTPDLEEFQLELFAHQVDFRLGSKAGKSLTRNLGQIRRSAERSRMKIEEWFLAGEMTVAEFVDAFNQETVLFQAAARGAMKAHEYRSLFGLRPERTVVLADPAIVKRAYPKTRVDRRRLR